MKKLIKRNVGFLGDTHVGIKIVSCNKDTQTLKFTMPKKAIITVCVLLMCAFSMSSCTTERKIYDSSASWETYCDKYGVDKYQPTEEQYNNYLDCYAGS